MLAKLTSKNQFTLPKSITKAIGDSEYFDVKKDENVAILLMHLFSFWQWLGMLIIW